MADTEEKVPAMIIGTKEVTITTMSAALSDNEESNDFVEMSVELVTSQDTSIANTDHNVEKLQRAPSTIFDLANEEIINEPLPLPYQKKCYSKLYYHFETFLVKHSRIHALWLLYLSVWPRGLVLLDMYTDGIIAFNLYKNNDSFLFSLSLLFIITPFMLVWVGSLRFAQKFFKEKDDTIGKKVKLLINMIAFLYIFPPIGAVLMFGLELCWVVNDILDGIKAFITGHGVVESNDRQFLALKVLF